MVECAYRGEKILEIEEKWIDENVKDEKERKWRKILLRNILGDLRKKADCRLEAVSPNGFCIFHDPEYWKSNPDEVRRKFLKLLKKGKEYFVGFHLPSIELPKEIRQELHMELAKFHGTLGASGVTFEGACVVLFCDVRKRCVVQRCDVQGWCAVQWRSVRKRCVVQSCDVRRGCIV